MPGGPAYAILGLKAGLAGVTKLNEQLGLNTPLWRQYVVWWWHVLHGNFGNSLILNRPVASLVAGSLRQSALLYTLGITLGVLCAAALGLVHGVFARGWAGRAASALEILLYAMPGFFIATLLSTLFAGWLHWLPVGGIDDVRLAAPGRADHARHLVLPALSVALLTTPFLARLLAHSVQAELGRDYVRTARARGLGFAAILWRHVLPNALRPAVTVLGYSLPAIFAGGVAVETIFDYPGLGWLLWRSAHAQDYPVLVGIVLLLGMATIIGNLAADIINSLLDPRARFV